MEIYRVENLTFRYPTAEKNALKEVSFRVNEGEFITICGLSGCGKSTLLRQLKTVLQPYGDRTGKIYFNEKNLNEVDLRTQAEKIGFVMQSIDDQSVTDKVWHELAFGLESLGMSNDVIKRRTAETAEFFGIAKWFEKSIDELSGGQKQILNLASVMVMQPDVLILDEPTAQLDPIAAENFISLLIKINHELGTTIILSEHSLNGIYGISDMIIVMSQGEIVSDTSPEKTAEKLYKMKNEVFASLPSEVKVYEYADGMGKCPLSVGEGRKWLERFVFNRDLQKVKADVYKKPNEKPVAELKNVWYRYGKNEADVLKGVDLKIYSGEILAVIGGNGVGKSTMLSVMSGIFSANRGKVLKHGKISVLPQDPQALFVRSTVEEDLKEIKEDIEEVVEMCVLGGFLSQHPYDLSGGEQQKSALAKVLLTEPDILLLDEPTKNLDSAYKSQLAEILRELAQSGKAVVLVSHDIEFCAEYADRCAMLFNGQIVSEGGAKEFFNSNGIYTTPINRMSRGIVDNTVTVGDMLHTLRVKCETVPKPPKKQKPFKDIKEKPKPKTSFFRKMFSAVLFLTAVFFMLVTADLIKINFDKILAYGIMFISAISFMVISGGKSEKIPIIRKDRNIKKLLLTLGIVFIIVPFTIYCGIHFFDDRKYLFISLLIMLESVVPFYVMFERRAVQARELVLISTICALCVSGRAFFYMIPEFKPVTALVIISGAALGSETGFLIGATTMLVSNIFFGQGAWTPFQMFTMGAIGFISGFVYQRGIFPQNKISLAVFGFTAAIVIYGGIMNPATILLSGTSLNAGTIFSAYMFGLPVDTIHAVSTALFLYIGAEPIISKIERIKSKYGLIRAES